MTHIDTLLLALPASGKSEIRRYLAHVEPGVAARDFHLGPIVQLDDYPYVKLMRLVAEEVTSAGGPQIFFESPTGLMREPRDWGMLAGLLAEDYAALGSRAEVPNHPTAHLLDRFDRARLALGARPLTEGIPTNLLTRVARVLDGEIASFLRGLGDELGRHHESSTVIVEFARGGPQGAAFPLPEPQGYGYTLPHLGAAMLRRSCVLYVWVTPEESRRRNHERAGTGPEAEASVLHHRVPDAVMHNDYGTDDLRWLMEQDSGLIRVRAGREDHRLAATAFDNRSDFTSFLRSDPSQWPDESVAAIHANLKTAFTKLTAASH